MAFFKGTVRLISVAGGTTNSAELIFTIRGVEVGAKSTAERDAAFHVTAVEFPSVIKGFAAILCLAFQTREKVKVTYTPNTTATPIATAVEISTSSS